MPTIPPEVELKLHHMVWLFTGHYPPKTTYVKEDGTVDREEKRTAWQEGWNAGVRSVFDQHRRLVEWFKSLSEENQKLVAPLLLKGHLEITPSSDNGEITMFVDASDVFEWGVSDADPITFEELPELAAMCETDPDFGEVHWLLKKNNVKPQKPLEELMREKGHWQGWMDDLPDNPWGA